MIARLLAISMIVLPLAGCNSGSTRRTPELAPGSAGPATPTRNFFDEFGDTTMRIVQEPVRLMTPRKPDSREPDVYEPPSMVITRRGSTEPAPTDAKP